MQRIWNKTLQAISTKVVLTTHHDSKKIATARVKWSDKYQKKYRIRSQEATRLAPELQQNIKRIAKRVYRHLALSGYARIDFRLDENDKNTVLLFGDAAVAIWLAYDTEGEILKFSFGTDGGGFDKLMVKYGGSRFPLKDSKKISPENQDQYVRMDGRAIFTFMMKRIPVDINNCLIKNQLSMKDIDFFIFHQASRYMLNNLGAKLKIPEEKLVCSLDIAGNTVSSSIPLACERLLNNKNLKNKTLLFSGFGVGLSWGSVVVRF